MSKMSNLTRRTAVLAGAAAIVTGLTVGAAQPASAASVPETTIQIDAAAGFALSMQASPDPDGDFNTSIKLGNDGSIFGNGIPLSQKFVALHWGNDVYSVCSSSVSVGLGLSCLDVLNESTVAGAPLTLRAFSGRPSQQWRIRNTDPVRPRTRSIQNMNSFLFADTAASPVTNGVIRQRPFVNADQQRWFTTAV